MAYSIYEYQRLVGKIQDNIELRDKFISIFDEKDKKQVARFGLQYAEHLLQITGYIPNDELNQAFEAVTEWIEDKTNYHKARNIAFSKLNKEAKENNDIIKKKFIKTMSQIACIPHVKAHGLWGSDMAITLINSLFPNDETKVKEERLKQIEILQSIK